MCSAQPQATSSASKIASEMTLIALYDVGAQVAMLAHGALFQRFWRRLTVISHAERLITDEPSSVGEIVMIGAGRIEHRELNYYTIRKATFFGPPTAGAWPGPGRIADRIRVIPDTTG